MRISELQIGRYGPLRDFSHQCEDNLEVVHHCTRMCITIKLRNLIVSDGIFLPGDCLTRDMVSDTTATFLAFIAAIVVIIGIYMLITTFITGATRTIDMMGYSVGALLILEGGSRFATNYESLG